MSGIDAIWLPFLGIHQSVHSPVLGCEEAAAARGIPLNHELKTLVLASSRGIVAAHTCADRRISFEKLEQFGFGGARLLPTPALSRLGMGRGIVNPFAPAMKAIPHVCSEAVFERSFLTTNDGTFTGFVRFAPHVLRRLPALTVGDIDE